MDHFGDHSRRTSALADLGPLPEVVESNTETTWKMFMQLQAQHSAGFTKTRPSTLSSLEDLPASAPQVVSVDEVMAEARRYNRICPVEPQWEQLASYLAELGGPSAPPAITGTQFRRTPPLAKRMRVRDQVEWAAQHGLLMELHGFLASLSEEQWVHIGQ